MEKPLASMSNKGRNVILWRKRRKLGGVFLNEYPLEKERLQGDDGFSLAELLG